MTERAVECTVYLAACQPLRDRVIVGGQDTPPGRVDTTQLLNVELHEGTSAILPRPLAHVTLTHVQERHLVRRFLQTVILNFVKFRLHENFTERKRKLTLKISRNTSIKYQRFDKHITQ